MTHLLTCSPAHLLTCSPAHLLTCSPAHLLTCSPAHLLTSGRIDMGVNQRDRIRMSEDEIQVFLRGRNSMSVGTFGADGGIHLVAMWYGFLDGLIAMETKAKSQKAVNLRRDPRVTVLVETGESYLELRGVEIAGEVEIIEDADQLFEIGKSVFSRYFAPYTEELRPQVEASLAKRVGLVVHPTRIVSWDHSKLAV
jgi:PPOX class probable F420-dependent enzyme